MATGQLHQRPPLHRLKKAELVWLATHSCRHRHTYLQHYQCFLRDHPNQQRIGFLDIETSNLRADFGIMLSYCIKVAGEDRLYEGVITKKDLETAKEGDEDKKLVAACIRDLQNFDMIITYYGKRFDIPFLRTRALATGLDFPVYGTMTHIDLYDTIKHRFKLSSNRLKQANKVLLGKTDKTEIEYKYWRAAMRGSTKALKYVMEHNRFDVTDLEKLYNRVIRFAKRNDTSI